jgi:hypothetical protein
MVVAIQPDPAGTRKAATVRVKSQPRNKIAELHKDQKKSGHETYTAIKNRGQKELPEEFQTPEN